MIFFIIPFPLDSLFRSLEIVFQGNEVTISWERDTVLFPRNSISRERNKYKRRRLPGLRTLLHYLSQFRENRPSTFCVILFIQT